MMDKEDTTDDDINKSKVAVVEALRDTGMLEKEKDEASAEMKMKKEKGKTAIFLTEQI